MDIGHLQIVIPGDILLRQQGSAGHELQWSLIGFGA